MLVISKAEGARLYVFLNKLTNSFKSFFFASPSTWPGVGKNLLNNFLFILSWDIKAFG